LDFPWFGFASSPKTPYNGRTTKRPKSPILQIAGSLSRNSLFSSARARLRSDLCRFTSGISTACAMATTGSRTPVGAAPCTLRERYSQCRVREHGAERTGFGAPSRPRSAAGTGRQEPGFLDSRAHPRQRGLPRRRHEGACKPARLRAREPEVRSDIHHRGPFMKTRTNADRRIRKPPLHERATPPPPNRRHGRKCNRITTTSRLTC
jgi:hypothetical protein